MSTNTENARQLPTAGVFKKQVTRRNLKLHDKSLKELCGQLSISIATGRNWVKLGKITPQYIKNGVPYFDEKHIAIIENEIRSGKNVALKKPQK